MPRGLFLVVDIRFVSHGRAPCGILIFSSNSFPIILFFSSFAETVNLGNPVADNLFYYQHDVVVLHPLTFAIYIHSRCYPDAIKYTVGKIQLVPDYYYQLLTILLIASPRDKYCQTNLSDSHHVLQTCCKHFLLKMVSSLIRLNPTGQASSGCKQGPFCQESELSDHRGRPV